MAISVEEFSGLVSGVHEAALEPSLWPETLHRVLSVIGCSSGGLMLVQPGRQHLDAVYSALNSEAVAAYNTYYGNIDPVASSMKRAPAAGVQRMGDIMPWPELQRTEIYNDWALQYELCDGLFAPLLQQDSQTCILCLTVNKRGDLFERADVLKLVSMLVPHLRQALRSQSKLIEVAKERDGAQRALDHARHGVVLAAPGGKILFANSAAVTILNQHDGLVFVKSRLRAEQINEDNILCRLMRQSGERGDGSPRTGGSLLIHRSSGRRPLAVHVLPLGKDKHDFTETTASVLVLIIDPQRDHETDVSALQRLYGLTKAEAAVAVQIMRGHGLQSAANALSVSVSTVRIHQQRVFEKTGTHRQAELVRLLLGLRVGLG